MPSKHTNKKFARISVKEIIEAKLKDYVIIDTSSKEKKIKFEETTISKILKDIMEELPPGTSKNYVKKSLISRIAKYK